jgi:hypothetical protein
MKRLNPLPVAAVVGLVLLGLLGASCTTAPTPEPLDEQMVADAYVYLLGRALVVRQEQTDIAEPGVEYNAIKYNPLGSADFVNPNLDVAYLEAWIAVDDDSPVVLEVPPVRDRYYTAQICDEWGEVITNLNERNYPDHPHGKFAFVAPGSKAEVPAGSERVELHSRKAKLLARVELQTDPEGAVEWQRQFTLTVPEPPDIEPAVPLPSFDNESLIGVEIFDHVDAMLAGVPDVSPVADEMEEKVRRVASQAADSKQRAAIDDLLRTQVIPDFLKYAVTEAGTFRNNWLGTLVIGNYGEDYKIRTAANLVGIWANASDEVIYYVGTRDAEGDTFNGSNAYLLYFPAEARPDGVVHAYWSVILVDVPGYRVVPNPLNRFNLNSYSPLQDEPDGSLKILVSAEPDARIPESNWLPAPDGAPFSLTLRTYVPKDAVKRGEWFPPAVERFE